MLNKGALTIVVFIILFLGVWFLADSRNKSSSASPSPSPDLQLNFQNKFPTPTPKTTPTAAPSSKLEIEDITVGKGDEVKSGDTIEVNYIGTLENGQKFDSSYDRGQAFTTQIGTGQVIKGWDMGLLGMKPGGKRRLTIPPSLGYGDQQQGNIPPNSTLIFEIELVSIQKAE